MTVSTPTLSTAPVEQLQIDVWSDLACPWCYIGKSRLDRAIASSSHADAITVVVRSFELDPTMSGEPEPNLERLRVKYGVTTAQARDMEAKLAAVARSEGLLFSFDRLIANSFDVHRVLHLAGSFGVAEQLLGALQRTLFGGQANAYEHSVLADAAEELGVPRSRVEDVLAGDEYADGVRADEAEARRIGVTGVPFVVFGGRSALPGAVSAEAYAKAIDQVWSRQ